MGIAYPLSDNLYRPAAIRAFNKNYNLLNYANTDPRFRRTNKLLAIF
jgi:hypothetical protein